MPKRTTEKKPVTVTGMHSRTVGLVLGERGIPTTLNDDDRSVDVVCSTEQPCMVLDWDRWEIVPEVLLMSGCQMPAARQVPLLDSHQRYATSDVIGSCREMRIEGAQLVGRACYSTAPEAEGPYLKMKEGHLTDYSIGYRYDKKDAVWIAEGESGIVDGRTFTGPVKVVRKWTVKELSACPIGADDMAKARAATAPEIPHMGEENEMDPKIRAFLEGRGLSKDATEEEAHRFLQTLDVRQDPPALGTGLTQEDVQRAITAEHERFTEIDAMCARAGITGDERTALIKPGITVDAARKVVLEKTLTATPAASFRGAVEVGQESRDKFRTAAEGALIIRAGMNSRLTDVHAAVGARDLAGFSLRELARESLRMAGQSVGGSPLEMVGRALTSSDLPTILGNIANLSLMEGWDTSGETWQTWCATGSVSDFKIHTMARVGESDDLDEIPEDAEYKHGSESEQKEQYKVVTYGKLYNISRQAIINDELAVLTDKPRGMGEAAARKVGDLPYAVLTANAAMGDGVALFHTTTHKNLASSGAVVDVTSLGAAEAAMGLQKDIRGKRRLNIRPQFYIAPLTKKTASEQFFLTPVIGTQASPNVQNIYSGAFFTRVYDPRLDDASTTAWYLAGPKGKTVVVFFLNGNQTPYMETQQGWNVDGVQMKVRIDAGAKAKDWKGLYKNPGA